MKAEDLTNGTRIIRDLPTGREEYVVDYVVADLPTTCKITAKDASSGYVRTWRALRQAEYEVIDR